jgi:hypothetical protein
MSANDDDDDGRAALEAIYGLTLRLGEALAAAREVHVHPENHDGRAGVLAALHAVAAFVEAFPPFREAALSLPLRALEAALFELDKGGAPPVMLTPAKVSNRSKRSLDEGALVLVAAVAMEAAIRTRVPQPAARVADLLRARGYTNGKKEITGATVRGWRARLNEGPGGVMEDVLCDLWRRIKVQMDADATYAARGPAWFVDRLPDLLLDTGSGFRKKPPT